MKRLVLILMALALAAPRLGAQGNWASADYDFVEYLIDNGLKADAKALLFGREYAPSDTLTFLRGWTAYQLKELELADGLLTAVPQGSPFYEKALFYSTVVSANLGDFSTPAQRLEAYSGPYAELKGMQLACLALLRDDPAAFKSAAQSFGYEDFVLQGPERELEEIYTSRYEKPSKSPWLAAAASAVVPGLGKVYAGKVGEGISAFILTGILGAITAEHWVKDGPADWKTIVPGALCGALYLGSIYGSYVSVSIYNSNLKDAQNTAVMYNVHVPLRSVFR